MAPLSGGTFSRNYDWTDDRDAGIKIRSDRQDEELDDIAVALSTALYKDGQQTPTANIPMGGFKLTGLGTPTATTDAATKAYVDTAASPAPRITVRIATTANVNLTTDIDDGSTVDGVAVAENDLILLKNQTNATQNGVYVVPAASGTAARDTAADTWDEHVGLIVAVTEGSVGADTLWVSMVNSGGTLGSTDITFAPSGATIETPVPLSLGGLGNALTDPGADRIPFWDDGAGQIAWLAPTTGIEISGTALNVTAATNTQAGIVEKATIAEIWSSANNRYVSTDLIDLASAAVVLTHAAPTALDWADGIYRTWTMTASVTLGNPTNGQPGTWRTIRVIGDSTTDRTITFDTQYVVAPTITDVDSAQPYLLSIFCHTASIFYVFARALF